MVSIAEYIKTNLDGHAQIISNCRNIKSLEDNYKKAYKSLEFALQNKVITHKEWTEYFEKITKAYHEMKGVLNEKLFINGELL